MKRETTYLEGVCVCTPDVHSDDRGRFLECFREPWFAGLEDGIAFVQDNISVSRKGVLRGLHFQNPTIQGKLVQVVHGSAFDVAVDLRKDSSTFGRWFGIELNALSHQMLWIPGGFAHGFQALEDGTVFHYKCTGFYDRTSEHSLRWNDPDIDIGWPIPDPLVSSKDAVAPFLSELAATELF